ncbi:MAG TPA: histidine utilization repressor [Woeseiaceae bacterium]|nr:histidine utilization repressor [Woeseiaceae bacterium]
MSLRGKPRYQALKDSIIGRIAEGELKPGDRVPSENELVLATGVSRMTANRALRELTDEGYVRRVAGRGTFVADVRAQSHVREIQNIADEISSRGHRHSADVVSRERVAARGEPARALHVAPGTALFHLLIVHRENGIPIQVEDRYVLAEFAPQTFTQDFSRQTPSAYLTSIMPFAEAEQVVRAEMPDKRVRRLLDMDAGEPVLVVIRRTWAAGRVVTFAHLYHPGSRYELTGHYQPAAQRSSAGAKVVQLERLKT